MVYKVDGNPQLDSREYTIILILLYNVQGHYEYEMNDTKIFATNADNNYKYIMLCLAVFGT